MAIDFSKYKDPIEEKFLTAIGNRDINKVRILLANGASRRSKSASWYFDDFYNAVNSDLPEVFVKHDGKPLVPCTGTKADRLAHIKDTYNDLRNNFSQERLEYLKKLTDSDDDYIYGRTNLSNVAQKNTVDTKVVNKASQPASQPAKQTSNPTAKPANKLLRALGALGIAGALYGAYKYINEDNMNFGLQKKAKDRDDSIGNRILRHPVATGVGVLGSLGIAEALREGYLAHSAGCPKSLAIPVTLGAAAIPAYVVNKAHSYLYPESNVKGLDRKDKEIVMRYLRGEGE